MPSSGRLERILYIDDSQLDRDLVRDAISTEPALHLTETTCRQEFQQKLAAEPYDLVLSDFNILGYDGLQVISSVQDTQPTVPVVIVTGTGSEEIAVEAMKLGAADYVIKSPHHIVRLPLTIQTVLEKTRLAQEEERLRAEMDHFFEVSHDMLLVLDALGRIQRANPAVTQILQFSGGRLREMSIGDLVSGDDRARTEECIKGIKKSRESVRFTVCCVRNDGSECWVEWNVFRANGPNQLFSIGRDITQHRKTEAEERERAVAKAKMSMLSPREKEVLRLVVAGNSNKQIAHALNRAQKTVEKHRAAGMHKLKLSSVPDLVRMALMAEL